MQLVWLASTADLPTQRRTTRTKEATPTPHNKMSGVGPCIVVIANVFMLVVSLVALHLSVRSAVIPACGMRLWDLALLQLVLCVVYLTVCSMIREPWKYAALDAGYRVGLWAYAVARVVGYLANVAVLAWVYNDPVCRFALEQEEGFPFQLTIAPSLSVAIDSISFGLGVIVSAAMVLRHKKSAAEPNRSKVFYGTFGTTALSPSSFSCQEGASGGDGVPGP